MSSATQQHERAHEETHHTTTIRNILLLLLAGAAGAVDAISYTRLDHVFTAAMTGNTVLLGLAIGQVELQAIYFSGVALLGFVVGATVGAWIAKPLDQQHEWSSRMTAALVIEVVVLIGVLACWCTIGEPLPKAFWQPALIAATAVAMGTQSAAVHQLSIAGVSTTFVTGTITSIMARGIGQPHLWPKTHCT